MGRTAQYNLGKIIFQAEEGNGRYGGCNVMILKNTWNEAIANSFYILLIIRRLQKYFFMGWDVPPGYKAAS